MKKSALLIAVLLTPPLAAADGHASRTASPGGATPALPGQDAFGALQEIVGMLEADPATEWSRVDISGLREHLVDMNELTLRAAIETRPVPGGFEARVTGSGRTLEAIRRMVPAHARMLAHEGLAAEVRALEAGVLLNVTSSDPERAVRLRPLGFFGVMTLGAHHPAHHLAIARGQEPHGSHPR